MNASKGSISSSLVLGFAAAGGMSAKERSSSGVRSLEEATEDAMGD